jgi:hypothetical protein
VSDIAPLVDGGKFFVLERDNQRGPDAAIKKVYMIDLEGETPNTVVTKTLVNDLVANDLLTPTNGLLPGKVEGLAVDQDGRAWILTDNDGVDEKAGETLFFPAFQTAYRPAMFTTTTAPTVNPATTPTTTPTVNPTTTPTTTPTLNPTTTSTTTTTLESTTTTTTVLLDTPTTTTVEPQAPTTVEPSQNPSRAPTMPTFNPTVAPSAGDIDPVGNGAAGSTFVQFILAITCMSVLWL